MDDTRGDGVPDRDDQACECPPASALGGGTNFPWAGAGWRVSLWLSVRPFVPPALLRLPLNPPLLSPLPTNWSGDQGDQLGAGRGAGRAVGA